MADIFLSYSRADRERVAPLVRALEVEGWSVWWDPQITPGQEFDTLISGELEQARTLVVAWTNQSVDSRWVRGEFRRPVLRGARGHGEGPGGRAAGDLEDREGGRGPDTALELLQSVTDQMNAGMLKSIEADSDLDPIRDDPQFRAMLDVARQRLGEIRD